jgi:hypothetical protein
MWWWLLVACNSDPTPDDSAGSDQSSGGDSEEEPCLTLELEVDGPSEPRVGDAWTLYLYCDEALLTGPMIVQATPASFATIDLNEVTFVEAGEGSLRVQVGGFRVDQAVTVAED